MARKPATERAPARVDKGQVAKGQGRKPKKRPLHPPMERVEKPPVDLDEEFGEIDLDKATAGLDHEEKQSSTENNAYVTFHIRESWSSADDPRGRTIERHSMRHERQTGFRGEIPRGSDVVEFRQKTPRVRWSINRPSRGRVRLASRVGIWERFRPNGEPWIRGVYSEGKKHGVWRLWSEGGKLQWLGYYSGGNLLVSRSSEHRRAPGEIAYIETDGQRDLWALALAPDAQTLAVAWDKQIVLYDAANGQQLKSFDSRIVHYSSEDFLRFSPDGTILAACGLDADAKNVKWVTSGNRSRVDRDSLRLELWNCETGESFNAPPDRPGLNGIHFFDGTVLVLTDATDRLKFWDVKDGKYVLNGVSAWFPYAVSADRKRLAAMPASLRSMTARVPGRKRRGSVKEAMAAAQVVRVWDLPSGELVTKVALPTWPSDIALDGNLFLAGNKAISGGGFLYDLEQRKRIATSLALPDRPRFFVPGGNAVFVNGFANSSFVDTATGRLLIGEFPGNGAVAGKHLVTRWWKGSPDVPNGRIETINIWDLNAGIAASLLTPSPASRPLSISDTGRRLAFADVFDTIRVVDVENAIKSGGVVDAAPPNVQIKENDASVAVAGRPLRIVLEESEPSADAIGFQYRLTSDQPWRAAWNGVAEFLAPVNNEIRFEARAVNLKGDVSDPVNRTIPVLPCPFDTWVRLKTITWEDANIERIALSPDGTVLATADRNRNEWNVRLFSIPDGRRLRQWAAPGEVTDIAFSRDGSLLMVNAGVFAQIHRVANGALVTSLPENKESNLIVKNCAFHPNGKDLIVIADWRDKRGGAMQLRQLSDLQVVAEEVYSGAHNDSPIEFSSDGTLMLVRDTNPLSLIGHVYSTTTLAQIREVKGRSAFTLNGSSAMAVLTREYRKGDFLTVHDFESGEPVSEPRFLNRHKDIRVSSYRGSADDRFVLGYERDLLVYDLESTTLLYVLPRQNDEDYADARISPSGKHLVVLNSSRGRNGNEIYVYGEPRAAR